MNRAAVPVKSIEGLAKHALALALVTGPPLSLSSSKGVR